MVLHSFERCGVLTIMNEKPNKVVVDSGTIKTMIGRIMASKLGITPNMLKRGTPYITASGAQEISLGSPKEKFPITIGRGTPNPTTIYMELHMSPSREFDVLLGNGIIGPIGGYSDP